MYWIRFGLLVVLLVRTPPVSVFRRRFSGKRATVDGESFEYAVSRKLYGTYGQKMVRIVRIAINLPDTVRFVMRAEGRFDRIAKWLGIANEWQTGDSRFDRSTYVLCDDPVMLKALSADAELRTAVQGLLAETPGGTLTCYAGKLVVTDRQTARRAKYYFTDSAVIGQVVARKVWPTLVKIRERIAAIQARPWAHERDPALGRQFIIISTTTVMGFAGIAAWLWGEGVGLPRQLTFGSIESHATMTSAGIGVVLLLLVGLRRTSRVHLVLLEIVLVGLPGAWFTSRALLAEVNQRLDAAPAVAHVSRVKDLYEERQGRGGRVYYVVVDAWPNRTIDRALKVPYSIYRQLHIAACARFALHPGYLGDLWLSAIEPIERCGISAGSKSSTR